MSDKARSKGASMIMEEDKYFLQSVIGRVKSIDERKEVLPGLVKDDDGTGEANLLAIYNDMSFLVEIVMKMVEKFEQAEKAMKSQQEIIEVNCAEYGQLQEKCKKTKEEIEFLKEELQQAQAKVERYEKALKTIAEHQYYGSIGAIGYYAEFKSIAKQALEESE